MYNRIDPKFGSWEEGMDAIQTSTLLNTWDLFEFADYVKSTNATIQQQMLNQM